MSAVTTGKAPWIVGRPVLLEYAVGDFLNEVTRQTPWRRTRYAELLEGLEEYLGSPAPLLAYTRLTGEAWLRSLPTQDQADAAELLAGFRAYLREWGWLDTVRPVNQPD